MLLQVLLICLAGLVRANFTEDIGEIPYENQGVIPIASPILAVSPVDYGEIPYDKGPAKSDDYGNIPYEAAAGTVVLKPRVDVDYGNIPYEGGLAVENASINIPGILQAILGGREVPGLGKTTEAPSIAVVARLNVTELATTTETVSSTFKMRASSTEDGSGDYKSLGTFAYDCNPAKDPNCTTCKDKVGYRIYCLNGTTTKAPTDMRLVLDMLVKITDIYWSNGNTLTIMNFEKLFNESYPGRWPYCPSTTSTTDTPSPTDAPSNLTGLLIAKCFVCGMFDGGIPSEDHICSDSYLSHAYKKHCKYLNRAGWHVNGTGDFYMWGRWTGGCALRYTDVSTVYHQRTCRNKHVPAKGSSYISRRMERLEYGLHKQKDGCLTSPTASLVPLSRGISLYSRFHVCVCSTNYCNRAKRILDVLCWYTVVFTVIRGLIEVLRAHLR